MKTWFKIWLVLANLLAFPVTWWAAEHIPLVALVMLPGQVMIVYAVSIICLPLRWIRRFPSTRGSA
jgi:hypothetical protein